MIDNKYFAVARFTKQPTEVGLRTIEDTARLCGYRGLSHCAYNPAAGMVAFSFPTPEAADDFRERAKALEEDSDREALIDIFLKEL